MKSADHRASERRARPTQAESVARAEAYVRSHKANPVPVSILCRVVGLSERGLRDAFYRVRGMSPRRSLFAQRLEDVRCALRSVHDERVTVTGIATDFGFYELGRFAAAYREAFGEPPSQTLRESHRTFPDKGRKKS